MIRRELRLEDLLGRQVYARDNRRVGRIEEFRAEWQGRGCRITAIVIGTAGLLERLGLGARMIIGIARRGGRVARWDQIDLSNPDRPRLMCAFEELEAA